MHNYFCSVYFYAKAMEEKERGFEEILKELIDHILKGTDERAIILVDELEKSADKLKEEKELVTGELKTIQEKAKAFLTQEGYGKQEKQEKKD